MTLLELSYQRRKAKAEATGLLDRAVNESRSLSISEQVRFDTLTARIHELDTAICGARITQKVGKLMGLINLNLPTVPVASKPNCRLVRRTISALSHRCLQACKPIAGSM